MMPRNVGAVASLGRGLEELETITEGVAHVDADIAGERLVVDDRISGPPQPGDELGEAVDQDARMSFARGTEVRVHAKVDFHVPVLEPAAAPPRELGGFTISGSPRSPE